MASFTRLDIFVVASLSHVYRLTETAFFLSRLLTFESQMASLELLSKSRENGGPQSTIPSLGLSLNRESFFAASGAGFCRW